MKRQWLIFVVSIVAIVLSATGCRQVCFSGSFFKDETIDHGSWDWTADANGGQLSGTGVIRNVDDNEIVISLSGDYRPGEHLKIELTGRDGGSGFVDLAAGFEERESFVGDVVFERSDLGTQLFGARGSKCQ